MDGIELLESLKKEQSTSHIPVILLTASDSKDIKLKGLKIGADAYLQKPFDNEELLIRVESMIAQRKKLQSSIQSGDYLAHTKLEIPKIENDFLTKAVAIVEDNISNDAFSVEDLSREIGMSRVQFHRKIKALTNKPTTHFIRSIRLNHAVKLLEQGELNITEVAYQVGFSSQSYFTKCFNEQYGKPPTAYIK